ncbi:glycosyltransferase family 4 protein [Cobetia amphilecti]|uniref:glycosyltransferase family 4 protein n=1 Tax=Cobetia amphilecti TaxID=1055104 RepID=UPI003297EB56
MESIKIIQPSIPRYRLPFYNNLSLIYSNKFKVYYSSGDLGILTKKVKKDWAISLGSEKKLPLKLAWQSNVSWIKISKSDIIVLSGNPRYISTIILLLRAKCYGAKIVWWGHYWSSSSRKWRQYLRFLPMYLSSAILFYTDEEVVAFEKECKIKNRKCIVSALNNGLEIKDIEEVRGFYNPTNRYPEFLFIGRLTEKTKLETLFEALSILEHKAPLINIIGDGPLREHLEDFAKSLGVNCKIIWHGGLTTERDISVIANRCLGFIYPGEVGLSLIHAMAYGLPAIVHNNNKLHMPEISAFGHGLTGLTFKYNDATSLSNTISKFTLDSRALEYYSEEALKVVKKKYNTDNMTVRFLELIENLGR